MTDSVAARAAVPRLARSHTRTPVGAQR
jgi:hypothetical protein